MQNYKFLFLLVAIYDTPAYDRHIDVYNVD